jgi:hypothetical protein
MLQTSCQRVPAFKTVMKYAKWVGFGLEVGVFAYIIVLPDRRLTTILSVFEPLAVGAFELPGSIALAGVEAGVPPAL